MSVCAHSGEVRGQQRIRCTYKVEKVDAEPLRVWKSGQASRVSLRSGVSTWLCHIVRGDKRNNISRTESNERQRQRGAVSEAISQQFGGKEGT